MDNHASYEQLEAKYAEALETIETMYLISRGLYHCTDDDCAAVHLLDEILEEGQEFIQKHHPDRAKSFEKFFQGGSQ